MRQLYVIIFTRSDVYREKETGKKKNDGLAEMRCERRTIDTCHLIARNILTSVNAHNNIIRTLSKYYQIARVTCYRYNIQYTLFQIKSFKSICVSHNIFSDMTVDNNTTINITKHVYNVIIITRVFHRSQIDRK